MNNKYLYIIIAILVAIIFLQRSCNRKTVIKTNNTVSYDTVYRPKYLPSKVITNYKNIKGETINVKGRIDTVIVKQFEMAGDIKKDSLFKNAIKIRQYSQDFNDSLADVSIFAETQGELLKLAPTIKIKARLPEKKSVFAVYAGGGLYTNTSFSMSGYKLNLRVQNKRGDLISASYNPVNKSVFAEYDLRIINIKK